MNAGGHLIVGEEQVSDVGASPWLRSVMPWKPKDVKTIEGHAELQAWLKSPLDYQSRNTPQLNRRLSHRGTGATLDAPAARSFRRPRVRVRVRESAGGPQFERRISKW